MIVQVRPVSLAGRDAAVERLFSGGAVRAAGDLLPGAGIVPDTDLLPVLPALQALLPGGGLRRGSVVALGPWSLLCLALAAGPTAAGAWCAVAGLPELGVTAAIDAGLDPGHLLLVPDLGPHWHQVLMSLLDGFDLVLFRPPDHPSAQVRRKLEAAVRKHGVVLLVAGPWDGATLRLSMAGAQWAGIGPGYGRLRARRVQVVADGRGGWARPRARWLWLPGPDGSVSEAAEGAGSAGSAEVTEPLGIAGLSASTG
jgi:hypothetical protein